MNPGAPLIPDQDFFTMGEACNAIRNVAGDEAAREAVRTLSEVLDASISLDNMKKPEH